MGNKYYAPGDARAARVRDLFAAVAPRYDLINDVQSFGLHRVWKRRLVRLARPQPGERALDVCCGTGDIAFRLAGAGARVVGVDFSESMLAVARERAKQWRARRGHAAQWPDQPGEGAPRFAQGDAQALAFADGSFDVVTVGYGLRNLASWEQGLREMWRVAKPGGRVLVLDFGKPEQALWRAIYFFYLRRVAPLWGRLFCGDAQAYGYILESLRAYPAQRGVDAKLRELGAAEARLYNLLGGVMGINYARKG
jgi:demethylmenaquinone methyltransferase/2-methoxy-6-polyprenyl-1,4-benzoquinol methylase